MENNTFLEVVSTFSPSDEILPHPNISYYLYIVAVLIPCLLFHFKPPKQAKSHGSDKVPQPYPYLIPVLAHAVPFAWNTPRFVTNVAYVYIPCYVRPFSTKSPYQEALQRQPNPAPSLHHKHVPLNQPQRHNSPIHPILPNHEHALPPPSRGQDVQDAPKSQQPVPIR